MADEDKTEETPAEVAETAGAPEAPVESAAPAETPAAETAAPAEINEQTASAAASEPVAEEAAAAEEAAPAAEEAAEAPEAPAAEAAPAAEPAAPAEPQVLLTPKERKAAIKTRKAAKVGQRGETSNEERQAERDAVRAKKAAERRTGRAKARAKWKAGAHERTATPAREHETGQQKTRQGVVVSDKADKTITVRIDVSRRHRKYQKIVRTSNTLHAHDERNDAHIGDTVVVREARPLSRSKRWRLVEVVERAK
jgi:small subunit ribosomal protein S17